MLNYSVAELRFIKDLENKSYRLRLDYSKLQGRWSHTTASPPWDFVAKITILFWKMFYLIDKI